MEDTAAVRVLLTAILERLEQLSEKVDRLNPITKRHLSATEAAEAYGVSAATIRRACDRRELRFSQRKPGAAKRISTVDLEEWITQQTHQARRHLGCDGR